MAMDPVTMQLIASGGMAGLGALGSLFGHKKPAQTTQLPTRSPEQMALQSQAGQMAMQGLQDPTAGFDPIAQQARSQFQTQTIPGLAERFTSMGQGAQRGSDFAGALGGAGSELEENLAAQKAQFGLQNQGLLQQLLGIGMQPSFQNIHQPGQMGGMQRFGSSMFEQGMPAFNNAMQSANTSQMMPQWAKMFNPQQGTQPVAPQQNPQSFGPSQFNGSQFNGSRLGNTEPIGYQNQSMIDRLVAQIQGGR